MLFYSFSGVSTCSGDLELDSSGVIFISLDRDIDREIDQDIDQEIDHAIVVLIKGYGVL